MNITLYTNTSPLNSIHRALTQVASINGALREGCKILNPDIRLEYNAAYLAANYAYIPDFGRYYYYRDQPSLEGDVMVLHLYTDSLYNFRSQVLAADCIAERSSSRYDVMLDDSAVIGAAGYEVFSRSLPYEFRPDQGKYVLIVAGG